VVVVGSFLGWHAVTFGGTTVRGARVKHERDDGRAGDFVWKLTGADGTTLWSRTDEAEVTGSLDARVAVLSNDDVVRDFEVFDGGSGERTGRYEAKGQLHLTDIVSDGGDGLLVTGKLTGKVRIAGTTLKAPERVYEPCKERPRS
jgi:hypothetical protein